MDLKVIIEEQSYTLPLDDDFVEKAASFFDKMDQDMDKGWQMNRDWVDQPSPQQKLIIVADKLLTAIENDEKNTAKMMVGYIKSRAPAVSQIEMDVTGELGHDFIEAAKQPPSPQPQTTPGKPLSKMEALQQAGNEVSRVFKTGKQYKFSMLNQASGHWEESPAIASKEEAENMREFAVKKRFEELSS